MNINTMTFVAPNLACGEARGGRNPPESASLIVAEIGSALGNQSGEREEIAGVKQD